MLWPASLEDSASVSTQSGRRINSYAKRGSVLGWCLDDAKRIGEVLEW